MGLVNLEDLKKQWVANVDEVARPSPYDYASYKDVAKKIGEEIKREFEAVKDKLAFPDGKIELEYESAKAAVAEFLGTGPNKGTSGLSDNNIAQQQVKAALRGALMRFQYS